MVKVNIKWPYKLAEKKTGFSIGYGNDEVFEDDKNWILIDPFNQLRETKLYPKIEWDLFNGDGSIFRS